MSGYARWKENRIRQEIHLTYQKHATTSSNGAGVDGTYPAGSNGTSVRFLEQRPDTGPDKQGTRIALLAIALAAWLWAYLGQFAIHR
jgi:hypothetical protein